MQSRAGEILPRDARKSGLWDQGVHDVLDIRFELVMVQARLLQLQAELQEADVGRIGQARAVLGAQVAEAVLARFALSAAGKPARSPG